MQSLAAIGQLQLQQRPASPAGGHILAWDLLPPCAAHQRPIRLYFAEFVSVLDKGKVVFSNTGLVLNSLNIVGETSDSIPASLHHSVPAWDIGGHRLFVDPLASCMPSHRLNSDPAASCDLQQTSRYNAPLQVVGSKRQRRGHDAIAKPHPAWL